MPVETSSKPAVAGSRLAGYTLIEVLVALLILTMGMLALAGTTALVVRQTTLSNVTTERSAVLQTVLEELKATPFADLASGSTTSGDFTASWQVSVGNRFADVEIITNGPGLQPSSGGGPPILSNAVADTFNYRIIQ